MSRAARPPARRYVAQPGRCRRLRAHAAFAGRFAADGRSSSDRIPTRAPQRAARHRCGPRRPRSSTRARLAAIHRESASRHGRCPQRAAARWRGRVGRYASALAHREDPASQEIGADRRAPAAQPPIVDTNDGQCGARQERRQTEPDPHQQGRVDGGGNPPARRGSRRDAQQIGRAESPGNDVIELEVLRHADTRAHTKTRAARATTGP